MTIQGDASALLDRLVTDYDRYDEYVDVVSCFEFMFTDSRVQLLPETVKYFQRFPRCTAETRGQSRVVTPDFVVIFKDDSVLIGEIASIATYEKSVDKLCSQLQSYEEIVSIPCDDGQVITPRLIDVVWLVPTDLSNPACNRVLKQRFLDPNHPYKPVKAPSIVSYARLPKKYSFSRIPHPDNGILDTGVEPRRITEYLDQNLNIRPEQFVHIKTARGFMNDAASPLYLATYLYLRFWPIMFGAGTAEARTTSQQIALELQRTYGYGSRAKEVVKALELLESAGLARKMTNGTWVVKRTILGVKGDRDAHLRIIELIRSEPERSKKVRRSASRAIPNQESLF
jgi:hypothetical protein